MSTGWCSDVKEMSRRRLLRAGALVAAAGALPGCVALSRPPGGSACATDGSDLADDEIPGPALDAYLQAVADTPLAWTLLAAIGWVESRHTPEAVGPPLDGGRGVRAIPASDYGTSLHGDPRWERAVGMMQFLPGTFRSHRRSSAHDPFDPEHAAAAAVNYLLAVGAADHVPQALYRYNNSWRYVEQVLAKAADYDRAGTMPRDCDHEPELTSVVNADPEALINNPALTLPVSAIADLRHPRMDGRVVAIMQAIAEHHGFAVSVIKTGHSRCVGGGHTCADSEVSYHWTYRAVDIWRLDGQSVTRSHAAARELVEWTTQLDGDLRPYEVGSPFPDWTNLPGWFTDSDHEGHIHIGYAEP